MLTVGEVCQAIKCVRLFICISICVTAHISFLLWHTGWMPQQGHWAGVIQSLCLWALAGCHATLPPTEGETSKKDCGLFPWVEPLNLMPVKIKLQLQGHVLIGSKSHQLFILKPSLLIIFTACTLCESPSRAHIKYAIRWIILSSVHKKSTGLWQLWKDWYLCNAVSCCRAVLHARTNHTDINRRLDTQDISWFNLFCCTFYI